MESDDVGPHVWYQPVKQGENHKLYSCADDTDDGIEKKVSVASIDLS